MTPLLDPFLDPLGQPSNDHPKGRPVGQKHRRSPKSFGLPAKFGLNRDRCVKSGPKVDIWGVQKWVVFGPPFWIHEYVHFDHFGQKGVILTPLIIFGHRCVYVSVYVHIWTIYRGEYRGI